MRRRRARKICTSPADPVAAALVRVRKARRLGRERDAVNALRRVCHLEEHNAALWTMLGAACVRMGRTDEAVDAFRHALWLRERCGDEARADVTRRLLVCAQTGGMPDAYAA